MQKWEYCLLTMVYSSPGVKKKGVSYFGLKSNGALCILTPDGTQVVNAKIGDTEDLARIISNLGLEGWEMVGAGIVNERSHALYFKRPLE